MNVRLPEDDKVKYSTKDKIIYISAIILCVISLTIVIFIELSGTVGDINIINVEEKKLSTKSEEETAILKSEFENKFTNNIEKKLSTANVKKVDEAKEIIYTNVQKQETKENSYNVKVNIPYINIESEEIKKYNEEINTLFESKLKTILENQNSNTIYSVEYVASLNEDNIMSLMIKSTLKEGANAQRVIIKTYNYDMQNGKVIKLEEVLNKNNVKVEEAQKKVKESIEEAQKRVEDLKAIGYNIFSRDYNSGDYEISNTEEFYYTSNTLYIIYAYGNSSYTSELDVVVL